MAPVQSAADVAARFALDLARLVIEFDRRGYRVIPIEVGVLEVRKTREGAKVQDGVHMPGSRHYDRAAADLLVYRWNGLKGEWTLVVSGDDPVWVEVKAYWVGLGPDHASGLDWDDADHVSIASADGRK